MEYIKNISIRKYFESDDKIQHDILLRSLEQKDEFNDKEFRIKELTYSEVKYVYKLMASGSTKKEDICKIYIISFGINENEFYDSGIVELFSTLKLITDSFVELKEKEIKLLHSGNNEDEELWRVAGGDSLTPFSDLIPILELGKMFGMYPYDLYDKKYSEVLVLLTAVKRQGDVTSEFTKLKTRKLNKK